MLVRLLIPGVDLTPERKDSRWIVTQDKKKMEKPEKPIKWTVIGKGKGETENGYYRMTLGTILSYLVQFAYGHQMTT